MAHVEICEIVRFVGQHDERRRRHVGAKQPGALAYGA
jgi:hypothetical protein